MSNQFQLNSKLSFLLFWIRKPGMKKSKTKCVYIGILYIYSNFYTCRPFVYTAFLAIFQRHRYQDKVPDPLQDLSWLKRTRQYRPKKGHDEYFSVPVLDRFVSISTGLVPEPALCPDAGAGAAERSQETLYMHFYLQYSVFLKYLKLN